MLVSSGCVALPIRSLAAIWKSRRSWRMSSNPEEVHVVLEFPKGKLCITARRRAGGTLNILPNEPYIWIDSIDAEPPGHHLLRCYAPTVMARVRERLGGNGPIVFHAAANPPPGDTVSQTKLEQYYLSCGFTWYRNEKHLMSWAQTIEATERDSL